MRACILKYLEFCLKCWYYKSYKMDCLFIYKQMKDISPLERCCLIYLRIIKIIIETKKYFVSSWEYLEYLL